MIQARVVSKNERIEWCGDFLSFRSTSSVIIPACIVNACCARFLVQDSEVSDRGLCIYNPGGRKNPDTTTICLVLGPMQKKKNESSPLRKSPQAPQLGLRPDLASSYQRLNPLRSLLHLPPLSSKLKGFGRLCSALNTFIKSDNDNERIPCAATWNALGVLCPDASEADKISTFDVMCKQFPDHMHSLFELQFMIHTKCTCMENSPHKPVSIKSIRIDCSLFHERDPAKIILNFLRNMRDVRCICCVHSFDIQKAPPILAVYWIAATGKSKGDTGNPEVITPALHISMNSLFEKDDLDYQLVSVCSKIKSGASLWNAHCKSFKGENWKTIKDSDNIHTYSWDTTCRMWNHQSHLQLFYVKKSVIPVVEGDPSCIDIGRWAMVRYGSKGTFAAQIVEILKTPQNVTRYRVSWDDGDEGNTIIDASKISRPLLDVVNKPTMYHIGDDVLAKFDSHESYYPATIERCFTDKRFLIAWKDGKSTYRVQSADTIRALEADAGGQCNIGGSQGASVTVGDPASADSPSRIDRNTARISQGEGQQDQCVNSSVADSSDGKQLKNQTHLESAKTRSSSRAKSGPSLHDFSQSAPTKEGAILVLPAYDCFISHVLFFVTACWPWLTRTVAHDPQDIICEQTTNSAILFVPEDDEFAEYCKTGMDINLQSLASVRSDQCFQLKPRDDNLSLFDSKAETMSLPYGVSRIVAFKSSTWPVVILFQLERYREQNLYLMSADTSIHNEGHRAKRNDKLAAIEDLGRAIMHSLTIFNTDYFLVDSPGVAPINTLYIPQFPSNLKIRAKIASDCFASKLIDGLGREIRDCSPRVHLADKTK